jgi:hypothetical protein
LSLPRELTETVLNRLRMFVLTSKVTLEDAGDELVGLGVAGAEAEALLASRIDAMPNAPGTVLESGPLSVLRIEGPAPRFQVFGPVEAVSVLWEALAEKATPVGEDAWVLQDIRAGLPVVHLQTRESFVPQMANLQLVNGVSFTKGCYPGQEIVARMQYLGTLKRRMYRANVESDQRPLPGQEIYGAGSAEAQGTVVEARPDPEGGYQLLAVLNIAAADAGDLHLGDPSGPALRLEELPYAFDAVRKEGTGERA